MNTEEFFDLFRRGVIALEKLVDKNIGPQQVSLPLSQPKMTLASRENQVRISILNATQFKSDKGFARSDVIGMMSNLWSKDLSKSDKQMITYVLKMLTSESRIASNGKKTKAARYYFQREGGAVELLPARGSSSDSTSDSFAPATV